MAELALTDAERSSLLEERARLAVGRGLGPGAEGHRRSPTCGDEFTVHVGDVITWEGHGCVVSTAAASALGSLTPAELVEVAPRYLASVDPDGEPLDGFEEFAGIGRFPLRGGCATIAWRAALDAVGA